MPLTPDSKNIINGLTVYTYNLVEHNPNKIDMPKGKRKKTVAITIHNTEWINVASNTTPAEQYVRATQNGAMRSTRVNYYVDDVCAWQCMPDDYVNWSCADGTVNPNSGNNTSLAIEVIGKSKEAEANVIKLAAFLLKKYNLTVENGLRTHTYWLNVKDGKRGSIDSLNVLHNPYKNCLPIDSTELLTPNGWMSLKDIKVGQKIAQYDKGEISFVECQAVVDPYEETVVKSRYFEATKNHRMYGAKYSNLKKYQEVSWGDILASSTVYRIPTSGSLKIEEYLPLSDEQLLLLAWIQGDGYYMKDKSNNNCIGIEFHLKKQRKIDRIKFILDEMQIEYRENWCQDGSVHIRIYDTSLYDWAEQWLSNKKFTFKMLNMSQEQFEIFMNELYIIDGHKNERQQMYTSAQIENLDFIQALCTTHKTRSSLCTLGSSKKYIGEQPVCLNVLKTNASFCSKGEQEERKTMVSCVSVPSSYIVVRQNNHVFITGNCPAYILPHWSEFKAEVIKAYNALADNAAATQPEKKPTEPKTPSAEPHYYRIRKSWDDPKSQIGAFTTLDNAIKKWQEGYFVYDWEGNVVYPVEEEKQPEIIYCAYATNKWNSDIINYNDKNSLGFAGVQGYPMNGLAIKTDVGKISYRVHIKNGGWLSWITKFDKNDWYRGCAGYKTQQIDGVQISLESEEYDVKYRVSARGQDYYQWKTGGTDYAGRLGYPIDRIQIGLVKRQ